MSSTYNGEELVSTVRLNELWVDGVLPIKEDVEYLKEHGGGGIAIGDVSGATATTFAESVSLTWSDPNDVVIEGVTLAEWGGTVLVRKEGSAPESKSDGTQLVKNTTKNAYATNAFVDNNVVYGHTYYYRFFPYTKDDKYTTGTSISVTPARIVIENQPTQNGSITYNGSQRTASFLNYDSTKMSGTDMTATNAGTYTAHFTPLNGYCWVGGSTATVNVQWTIDPQEITSVPVQSGTLTYNGSEQTATFSNYDNNKMTVEDDSATNAGSYTAHFTPTNNYCWSGGSTATINVSWAIGKATGTATLNKNSVTLNKNAISATVNVSNATGNLSVSTSDSNVATATVSNNVITITSPNNKTGTCTITLNVEASTNYTAATRSISVTGAFTRTMTVKVDMTNSNPNSNCTYYDDAVSMTAGSDDWDEFFGHYPVLFKNGAEVGKLKKNDFTKFEDGTSADITSGNDGDVMIAFPRHGLNISTANNIMTITMTDDTDDSNYKYYAHQRGSISKDKFYMGAYSGYEASSKLRSLSGKTPTGNKTIGAFRTIAQANGAPNGSGGSGYDLTGFYQMTYIVAMFILKYKSTDCQTAVGYGFVDSSNSAPKQTGGTESSGMDWGDKSAKKNHVKFAGLEDIWGSIYDWIDGLFCDSSRNILTATQGFNDTGSGYTNQGQGATANLSGYVSKVQGTSEKGFLISEKNGSNTTYFCDYGDLTAGNLCAFGGVWNDGLTAGLFRFNVAYSASGAYAGIGGRLMYV